MPARCPTASYSARGANGFPQIGPQRAIWGCSNLLEEEASCQMKMTPDKVVVQFFPGNILANSWWVNPQVLYLPDRASFPQCGMNSFLSREAPGLSYWNIYNSRKVTNCPGGKVPLVSSPLGKGPSKHVNWNWLSSSFGNHITNIVLYWVGRMFKLHKTVRMVMKPQEVCRKKTQ